MEWERLVAVRLAKEGYGSPEEIMRMRSDLVLDALEFSGFCSDYEATYVHLNRDKK